MIFSGLEYTGKAPFDTVLFHGIVRDAEGRKMSKSLGNGIDPLLEIEKYGADALRFTLATGNSPGNDMRYSPERVGASRNFANKIWNAARFVLMNLDENEPAPHIPENLAMEDKWILAKYNEVVAAVTQNLDKYELGLAVSKLYDFIWDVFCDWYVEIAKIRLNGDDAEAKKTVKAVLVYVFSNTMKLLHPFMPFITEEIWQTLPHEGKTVMTAEWPEADEKIEFPEEVAEFEKIIAAVKAIRNIRAEMNVAPSRKAKLCIETSSPATFEAGAPVLMKLASGSSVEVDIELSMPDAARVVTDDATIYIPMNELVDFTAELARLEKELKKAEEDKEFSERKLNNPGFVAKAPQALIETQRAQLAKTLDKIEMLKGSIESIKKQM